MKSGSGIAVAGIWLGVGICSFNLASGEVVLVALCAMFATLFCN